MVNNLSTFEEAASENLPKNRNKTPDIEAKEPRIPRWKEDILPLKQDALFWNAIWISAGKPLNTALHCIMKNTRNKYHLQIRKNKRMLDTIKRNNLLEACLNGNNGILRETKSMRKCTPSVPNVIDGKSDNIPDLFATKYEKLYNSVDDKKYMKDIKTELQNRIKQGDIEEVEKITSEVLKEASNKLVGNKKDPDVAIISDYLINAPNSVYEHLATLLRSYLTHGYISSILAISTIIPLIKDKLGNDSDSNNYRSIALSSVILKLFDWVLLLTYQKNFQLDKLQFSYQQNCSTTMCTWMVIETMDYFLRNGSDIYVCVMDMTKAFDNVRHSTLFRKLLKRDLPSIVVRFLVYLYEIQIAKVKWNEEYSKTFRIINGVKQGAVLSAVLYCVYVDDMFKRLRKNKSGCWINVEYYGAGGYADVTILLSPSLDGLQEMINVCDEFAKEHNLTFSINENLSKCKTKCISILQNERAIRNLSLGNHKLPWVQSFTHLGCKVERKMDGMKQDIREKRARFIQKNNEICQEFHFAHPTTKMNLNWIYNSHFTGSPLWDMFSKEAEMISSTWNVATRVMCGVNRTTHRYFIEPLAERQHIKWSLIRRFINFTNNLVKSPKTQLANLYLSVKDDCRSSTGRNIRCIENMFDGKMWDDITNHDLRTAQYHPVADENQWRIPMVKELLNVRYNQFELQGFERSEINELLEYVCTT